jgi:hypothetical protein
MQDTVTKKQTPNWVGPVAAAVILIGGYVAYQEWKEGDVKTENCARLKRAFQSNMNAMMGPAESAIAESKRVGNQVPMDSLAGQVGANQLVLNQLNAECPGWETASY